MGTPLSQGGQGGKRPLPLAGPAESPPQGPLAALVARAEALAADVELQAVRRWKAEHPGRKAIGCLPVYAPLELVHAAQALPVLLLGGGEAVEIVRGDAYYQSYICQLPRSTIELGLNGALDVLDGVVFPSTCDVIRNLSGMWQLLFPGKWVRYLDLPQSFREDLGQAFYAELLREVREDLVRLTLNPIPDAALRRSIELYDENRRRIAELYALRVETPWLVPTAELYAVLRAQSVLPVEEHTALVCDYTRLARASGRAEQDRARVALTGCFCEQPPLGLIKVLESSGCYVVADDLLLGARFIRGDVGASDGDDPLRALARAFCTRGTPCPSVFLPRSEKGADLVAQARAARAEGVVFAAASFCDPALLDQPMTQKAVEEASLPTTCFKYAENGSQFQAIREQTGAFSDSIRIWSQA